MKNNITKISSCCKANVYPYFSFDMDNNCHIEKVSEGHRCVRCGKVCYVITGVSDIRGQI